MTVLALICIENTSKAGPNLHLAMNVYGKIMNLDFHAKISSKMDQTDTVINTRLI